MVTTTLAWTVVLHSQLLNKALGWKFVPPGKTGKEAQEGAAEWAGEGAPAAGPPALPGGASVGPSFYGTGILRRKRGW